MADGFFVATSVDFPIGVPIDVTGAFEQFRNVFSVTYEGDVLTSLDITGAAGTYDFDQLTVFGWTIDEEKARSQGTRNSPYLISLPGFITLVK